MNKRILIVALLAAVLVFGVATLSGCKKQQPVQEKKEKVVKEMPVEPEPVLNPLTGVEDYNEKAVGKRPVAFVVENHPDARPQWGMDDKKYSPDIILQGEVEGGITRTLWFFADYTALPRQIGPVRSARPPFIRFSEMFDSIFVHWGQSGTAEGYIGADTVFAEDKVDHINAMTYGESGSGFDRDYSRGVSSEHTGIFYGKEASKTIKEAKIRTDAKAYTSLSFSKEKVEVSDKTCSDVTVHYSRVETEPTSWTYDEESEKYTSDAFQNDVERDNLLILFDDTNYITKSSYHGGQGVTYCDYTFSGGKGYLISKGTYTKIRWKRKSGKLYLYKIVKKEIETVGDEVAGESASGDGTDESADPAASAGSDAGSDSGSDVTAEGDKGSDADSKSDESANGEVRTEKVKEMVSLNPGKTWIGWISANNGGSVEITKAEQTE